jgi:hypothetical protein
MTTHAGHSALAVISFRIVAAEDERMVFKLAYDPMRIALSGLSCKQIRAFFGCLRAPPDEPTTGFQQGILDMAQIEQP